jgi:hypothetical protein
MINWEFLERIDFKNQDGVYLHMIKDFMRNQFYDRVLMNNVCNQRCMDIGFGTGLLSVLALKHGADSIVAYESDQDRYQLGCEVIKLLKLQDRITLINQRYDHTQGLDDIDVVFTETVNGNLWWEGLYNSIPRQPGKKFLPGQYFLEIHAQPIPESFARGLIEFSDDEFRFAPGVDIDEKFVSTINLMICKKYNRPVRPRKKIDLNQGIVQFTRQQSTVWSWIPFQRAVTQGQCVTQYMLDVENLCVDNQPIDFNQRKQELRVDTHAWHNETVLIVPRAGMQHGQNKMYLDTGHWGPTEDPIILHKPKGNLVVSHDLHNGKISYKLEE